jgi:hypothetical protein
MYIHASRQHLTSLAPGPRTSSLLAALLLFLRPVLLRQLSRAFCLMGQPRWTPRSCPRTPGHNHLEGRINLQSFSPLHLEGYILSPVSQLILLAYLYFLLFRVFLFCLRNFHVRCSRTQPHFWEYTASACIIHLCSVFARLPLFPTAFPSGVFLISFLMCNPECYLFGGLFVSCYLLPAGPSVSH